MQYAVKFERVEAVPVFLAGHKRMVFTAGGQFHIMPEELFEIVYVCAPAIEPVAQPDLLAAVAKNIGKAEAASLKRPAKASPDTAPGRSRLTTAPTECIRGELPRSVMHAVALAIEEMPRTGFEVRERVRRVLPDVPRSAVDTAFFTLKKGGKIQQRVETGSGLDKWFVVAVAVAERAG